MRLKASGWILVGTIGSLAAIVANGCGSSARPAELDDSDASRGGGAGPCSTEGAIQACHIALSQHKGVTMCFDGTQTCHLGTWSSCDGPARPRPVNQPPDAGSDGGFVPNPSDQAMRLPESMETGLLLPTLRAATSRRVGAAAPARALPEASPTRAQRDPLRAVAERFETSRGEVRAILPAGVVATASVVLPRSADGFVRLEDAASHLGVKFRLVGAAAAPIAPAQGLAVYPKALDGAHVIHRVTGEGTEDFVAFAQRPRAEELRYEVDVSAAPGVRFVSNTLEFLEANGTPRLRVAPPYYLDSAGAEHAATLSVEGCAFDTSPAAPWGRAVTAPGSGVCAVRVTWSAASYPILVDPTWTATGSMATAREHHTATLVDYGKLLVAGGRNGGNTTYYSSAELYDPSTKTFAATGAMSSARALHFAAPFGSGAGLVLMAGGLNVGTVLNTAEIYNGASGAFLNASGNMVVPRYAARGTVLTTSANVLISGGYDATITPVASAELFDALTYTFAATGNMTVARAAHHALEITAGTVLVTGGNTGGASTNKADIYNEATGAFTATGNMVAARARHTGTLLTSGKVLFAGSWDQLNAVSLASAEIFDPATGVFTATGSMAAARGYHVGRLLPTGNVVVAGGISGASANILASTEQFSPATGTFAALGNMTSPRALASGSSLVSGTAMVVGGDNGTSTALASAELLANAAGATCSTAADCASGVCVDGVCCAGACGSACTTCTAGTGACTTVTNASDPQTCPSPSACNAVGVCVGPTISDAGAVSCVGNPCDPTCQSIATDAGTTQPEAGGGFQGSGDNLGGSPPGFINKELCEPCTGPFPQTCGAFTHYTTYDSCESDYHCNTSTGKCIQNTGTWKYPPASCPGVDLTVQGSCSSGAGSVFPVCNRGNTALASGTVIPFYIVNGNQWSNNPNGCPSLSTSCTFTLPTALLPGTCQTVNSCSWNGNAVVYVNSDNSIAECPQPTGPGCGDNWADIKAGGGCSSITSYQPKTITAQYTATCPAGTHVQWGAFNYATTVATNGSGSSNVTFTAQTAPLLTDGGTGTFSTPITTLANAVGTDPAVCLAPCIVDMFAKFGGVPVATNEILALQIVISPTPDALSAGSLNSYALSYSCPPSE